MQPHIIAPFLKFVVIVNIDEVVLSVTFKPLLKRILKSASMQKQASKKFRKNYPYKLTIRGDFHSISYKVQEEKNSMHKLISLIIHA